MSRIRNAKKRERTFLCVIHLRAAVFLHASYSYYFMRHGLGVKKRPVTEISTRACNASYLSVFSQI